MTRMIPKTINSVNSQAESYIFNIIKESPGTESWVCLHSLGLARHLTKRQGEIDFLVICQKGIFVLEVKGGGVSCKNGFWQTINREGQVKQLKENPFRQASRAMFSLQQDLIKHFGEETFWKNILFGYGVVFPDVPFKSSGYIGTEGDERQIYDLTDCNKPFVQYIERLASFARSCVHHDCFTLTEKDINALIDYLRPDFDLVPSLTVKANSVLEQMVSLEKEQYAVIDAIDSIPRLIIQGPAGTGKTLLAFEIARREVILKQNDVLLICFNRLLASFFEAKVKSEKLNEKITVKTIHTLMNDLIDNSSFASEFKTKKKQSDKNTLFKKLYPEYTKLALLEAKVTTFKTVIIDEAQDIINLENLAVLDVYVEQGLKLGNWRICCDVNNQGAVFGAFEQAALDKVMGYGTSILLYTNCRNTISISQETNLLTRPKMSGIARIQGDSVEYSWYKDKNQMVEKLTKILQKLLANNIMPSQITILFSLATSAAYITNVKNISLVQLTDNNIWDFVEGKLPCITYCSISSFKGLENDFIVLIDIENLDSEWWNSVVYVGMSRAKIGLYLLLNETIRDVYNQRLYSWMQEKLT